MTLLTIAVIAVPIVFIVRIARRLQQVSRGFSDPARLQRVFAESAAAALRRAGADPQAVAKLEGLAQKPSADRVADRNIAAHEARPLFEAEPRPQVQPLRRPPRLRPTQSASLGLDLGESFRLSEPPEIAEPRSAFALSNWFALVLFAGAAAYHFLR